VSQLKKTKAEISVWELLVKSPTHYQALQKVLQSVSVPANVEPRDLEKLVGHVYKQHITFQIMNFLMTKKNTIDRSYIKVQCNGCHVSFILIDNESALNVCPLRTATKIGIDSNNFRRILGTMKAFDSTSREILGEIDLKIIISQVKFEVTFQVVDIKSTFNLILGRPWLHAHKVVSSSLHQCLKFPINGEIIVVMAEPEIIIPVEAGSISIDQQVPLIDVKTEQNCFNPQKMLENLQK
jgi:G-patch domain